MTKKITKEKLLQVAAAVAAGTGPNNVYYEHNENGSGIAWAAIEYPEPAKVAKRSIEIAKCLIEQVEDHD
mgnify:CR=1 FL=1